jgi:hypothetical protein
LLHVATEFGMVDAARLLLDRGQTSTRATPWMMPASAGKRPFSTRSHSSVIEGYRWRNYW